MLSINPHAPADSIAALLNSNMANQQKTPPDYARDYNGSGLVGIISGLCNHKNSTIPGEDTNDENSMMRFGDPPKDPFVFKIY